MARACWAAMAAAVAAAAACGRRATVVPIPAIDSGIGRACGEDAPPPLLAARAIVSFYRYRAVLDLELVDVGESDLFAAVYRVAGAGVPPTRIFADVVRRSGSCVELASRGEPCDPLAYSPIPLMDFAEGVSVRDAAIFDRWEPLGAEALLVTVAAAVGDETGSTDFARASGTCAFELAPIPDAAPAAYPVLAWVDSAHVVRFGPTGEEFRTDLAVELEPGPGPAPRSAALHSDIVDVECSGVADRRMACIDECVLAAGSADATDAESATAACERRCETVPAESGRACSARVRRTTEWLDLRAVREGPRRYETAGFDAAGWPLDAECLEDGGDADSCRLGSEP